MKKLVIIVLVMALLALPQMARARGGGGGSFVPGLCIGGVLGHLLSAPLAAHPPIAPISQPGQCWKEVPEKWEMRWDPFYNTYVRELVPRHFIPCR